MANADREFRSVSGKQQTAEPGKGGTSSADTTTHTRSPAQQTSLPPPPHLKKQHSSTVLAASPPAGTSPQASRNTSPTRKDSRSSALAANISTQPSAAAIQRALSATTTPQLLAGSVTEPASRLPKASKSASSGSGDTTPQWPVSPRLKSPPPSASGSRRGSGIVGKVVEPSTVPVVNVPTASAQILAKQQSDDGKKSELLLPPPSKAPSRGPSGKSTLETVQENGSDAVESSPAAQQASTDLRQDVGTAEKLSKRKDAHDVDRQVVGSGNESAGNKSDSKRMRLSSASQPSAVLGKPKTAPKSSFTSLSSAKGRQGDGKQNMTVETETVASIPQSALNGPGDRSGAGRGDPSGSLRLAPSNETIRPKKERKKTSQKARSINQGTASSKADIFEARVANAVGEVSTSDSDETFVYESNPPEAIRRPRHHSRTPSVTSSHSTAEQRTGIRNFGDMLDDRKVAGKRSMKFSSNQQHDLDSPDSKAGTVRSHHARHIGKFGRSGSVMDPDSPFTQASKSRNNHLGSMTSRPRSPRSPNPGIPHKPSELFGRKQEHSFDFDGEGADDERTPLVGSVRTSRSVRHARRLHSGNSPEMEDFYEPPRRSRYCRGASGCCLAGCVFIGVVAITILLLFMSNRPLKELKIRKMENILATEAEVMLDLVVGAINPNALSVTITDVDVNVFASSKHAAGKHSPLITTPISSQGRQRQKRALSTTTNYDDEIGPSNQQRTMGGGVDHGTDPMPDDSAQTVLLGRIVHFDVPLTFESQVLSRQRQLSTGTLQLMKPGNKTEPSGSARWAKVLEHSFELIVRGKFIYQLPISTSLKTVAVEATVLVHPEDGIDEMGHMRIEPVGREMWWTDEVDD